MKRVEVGDEVFGEVYDQALEDTKMEMMKLIFAVAIASDIDPEDLSDCYNNDEIKAYAEEVLEALEK